MASRKPFRSIRGSDTVTEIKQKYNSWRSFKLPFEGNHFLNVAFYYGYQWVIYTLSSGELFEIANSAGNIRITSNQIQPRIRNLHAKMTKNKPIEEVIPHGWTTRSLHAASLTRKVLGYFREIHDEQSKDSKTANWLLVAGDCFRKIGFDPDSGKMGQFASQKEFIEAFRETSETGMAPTELGFYPNEETGGVNYHFGEVFDDVVPCFELYVPEYATCMGDLQEIMHVKILPIDVVKDKWGRRAKDVSPSANMAIANQFALRLMGMANPDVGSGTAISRALAHQKTDMCYVYELWKKPSRRHKRGRLTISAGETFVKLFDEDNPYFDALSKVKPLEKYGCIPIIRFGCIDAPGRFWSISPVDPMRPLQIEYNKTISDMVQNRATVGRNKIVAPKTANIDSEEIANLHGQFLEYSGIKAPEILPAVPLPQQVERETERNRQDMDTVSGSHEVSRAEVPSGVKSGIAINYLLEQDDTTVSPVIRRYERSKRDLAMMKIAIAKHFYTEQRIIEATDVTDAITVMHFTGADLVTNIRIVPGSALPQSRAALQATYLDLFERNAILDDFGRPDSKKLFELLSNTMPVEAFTEEQQLDLSRARRENIMLARGEQIVPQHYEDHKVHLSEHNKFRKQEEFYNLHPMIRQMFDMHVRIHVDFLAPPVNVASAQEMLGEGQQKGKKNGDTSRKSPSFMGQGSMGALNNPPSNRGGSL